MIASRILSLFGPRNWPIRFLLSNSLPSMWPSSVPFVGFCHSCVCRDPVHFPGFATVIRECLFETARVRSDVRNYESNKNGSAIQCFLVEKFTASILELADRGL